MAFGKETKPEKRETNQFEKRPQKDDAATKRALGSIAVRNTLKDKPKK